MVVVVHTAVSCVCLLLAPFCRRSKGRSKARVRGVSFRFKIKNILFSVLGSRLIHGTPRRPLVVCFRVGVGLGVGVDVDVDVDTPAFEGFGQGTSEICRCEAEVELSTRSSEAWTKPVCTGEKEKHTGLVNSSTRVSTRFVLASPQSMKTVLAETTRTATKNATSPRPRGSLKSSISQLASSAIFRF